MKRARIQRKQPGPALALPLILGLLLPGAGCRLIRHVADVPAETIRAVTPGRADKQALDPVEIQQTLLRLADEFATRLTLGLDRLQRETDTLQPAEILHWKIAIATESYSIVSGPSANANLLDFTVFVTVVRSTIEDHWQPEKFGEAARPMLESCRQSETNIWRLAGQVLKPEQQAELRRAIDGWRQANTQPENVLAARALGFTSRMAEERKDDAARPDSVFSLLNLDPLAGMDPAVREIAQTRLFAERALFVTQKLPTVLRWQAELLAVRAIEMPGLQQWVTNATRIASSVERFVAMTEKLPAQLSAERGEILQALESQTKQFAPLVQEVHQTLIAGGQMSTSLNTTLTTFDALMQRFGVGETNRASPPNTNAEPFRIQAYEQTAAQLEGTARQLTELLRTLDQTLGSTNLLKLSAQIAPVVQQAQTGGKEAVDYAFWKSTLLVAIVLFAALIYRFLAPRLKRASRETEAPP